MNAPLPITNPQPAKFHVSPSFVELLHKYGLVIIKRDEETNEPTWLACKFCPSYGCDKRRKDYLMVYDLPFDEKKAEKHLRREHCQIWNEYSKSRTNDEKSAYFSNMVLPPICKFLQRVEQLQKSAGYSGNKRKVSQIAPSPSTEVTQAVGNAGATNTGKGNDNTNGKNQQEQQQRKKARVENVKSQKHDHNDNSVDSWECYKFEPIFMECYNFNPYHFNLVGETMTEVYLDVLDEDPDLWAGRRSLRKEATQNTDVEMTAKESTVNATA